MSSNETPERPNKPRVPWSWLLRGLPLWALGITACVYSFSGFFPGRLKRVWVPVFQNQTLRYGLDEQVTRAFVDAIRADGRLEVVPEDQATLEIRGTVKGYDRTPFEHDDAGRVISYRITLRVEIGFYDRQEETYYLEPRVYTGRGLYRVEEESEDQGIQEAVEDLVDQALRALFLKEF